MAVPILFDKIYQVYETQLSGDGRRGLHLHTGYVLYQLLKLLGKHVCTEEFNTLTGGSLGTE
jgi:hypothetical protein